MKIFDNIVDADKNLVSNKVYYIDRMCPRTNGDMFCGTWCALFQYFPKKVGDGINTSAYVVIGCGNIDKIYIDDVDNQDCECIL